ncbi:MAG: formylglycine-generating enzyme family protein, partial [Thermoguttaceae bacterium]
GPKDAREKIKIVAPLKQVTVDLGEGANLKLVLIPAGEFLMGSGESAEATAAFFNKTYGADFLAARVFEDEHPQHHVRITRPFYLGIYHVTRGQFRRFVADTAYKTDAEKGEKPGAWGWNPDKKEFVFSEKYSWRNSGFEQTDEHPVVNVSWTDADAFCKWLSRKEARTYRLPTEAEWEYACRAGTTTRYYNGDDPEMLAKVGNVADAAANARFPDWKYTVKASDGYAFTSPVGSFKPNAFGLYDMHGNAWQWCADWYGGGYYAGSPTDDPPGPTTGSGRVPRGGGWFYPAWLCTSATRAERSPGRGDFCLGFRVSRVLPTSEAIEIAESHSPTREFGPLLRNSKRHDQVAPSKGPSVSEIEGAIPETPASSQSSAGRRAGLVALLLAALFAACVGWHWFHYGPRVGFTAGSR